MRPVLLFFFKERTFKQRSRHLTGTYSKWRPLSGGYLPARPPPPSRKRQAASQPSNVPTSHRKTQARTSGRQWSGLRAQSLSPRLTNKTNDEARQTAGAAVACWNTGSPLYQPLSLSPLPSHSPFKTATNTAPEPHRGEHN